jgi:hypothetical protein
LPWLPLSLDPYRTIASGLWLLPAMAGLAGILLLGAYRASWLAAALAVVTIVSIAIGALQISGGDQSPWYFYAITNFGSTTGFFSNANHFATLMVATIPFLAAFYLTAVARGRSVQKSSGLFVVLAGALVVTMGGIAINFSIAGIGLSVPVLAASLLMILSRRRRLPRWTPVLVALLLVGSVAAVFTAPFGNNLTSQSAAEPGGFALQQLPQDLGRSGRVHAGGVGPRHLPGDLPHPRGSGRGRPFLHEPRP